MDAFFASVEQRDRPELRGKPVLVGGSPKGRGVVAAASYESRVFGCRSAMPMRTAVRLCPQAEIVRPRFSRYREVSSQIMSIFRDASPLVEPLSVDEAFIDISHRVVGGSRPAELAQWIRKRVREDTELTVSCGVATSKSVAKIASDQHKPDGLTVVAPGDEAAFLVPLPISDLWGVGPKTADRLRNAGIETIGDLAQRPLPWLIDRFGSRGEFFLAFLDYGPDGTPLARCGFLQRPVQLIVKRDCKARHCRHSQFGALVFMHFSIRIDPEQALAWIQRIQNMEQAQRRRKSAKFAVKTDLPV